MMLTQKAKDLAGLKGRPPRKDIPREEVALHNTEYDCWTILDDKVYNITPYLKYHPGGVAKLMLSAGGDCTTLFNENHQWVNGHGMLEVWLRFQKIYIYIYI
jgi:cytochrome-b5 reductase